MNKILKLGGNPQLAYEGGLGLDHQVCADIAAGFQGAVVDTLVIKCLRAMKGTAYSSLVVAGGVSANKLLRERLRSRMESEGVRTYFPRPEFCTDNGAMIALAGFLRLEQGVEDTSLGFSAKARWPLDTL